MRANVAKTNVTMMQRRLFLVALLSLYGVLCPGRPLDPRYRRQVLAATAEIPSHPNKQILPRRRLQANNNNSTCSVCHEFPVLEDVTPHTNSLIGLPENTTCRELIDSVVSVYSDECLFFQSLFSGPCCDTPLLQYECEQNVRSSMLRDYDASVMPIGGGGGGALDVTLQLDVQHITDLSIKEGTVQVFVWIHLQWNDPRLVWQVTGDNCTSLFTTRASLDVEKTEIWVPDIDLLNQAAGVQEMPDTMATVYSDGTVEWRRNGGLKALCFFTGLNKFPFDTLGCSFIFGTWVRDHVISIVLNNGTGFQGGESLNRVIYNEYTLAAEQTETGYYAPPLKNYVFYNLYFERSSRYYVLKILVPTMCFTILAFGVFFLDLRVGERLTYGLTVMLVIIAQDISTSSLLPITDKRLWINTFVNGSFYWVLIANLESIFVAWLYFLVDEAGETKPDKDRKPSVEEPKEADASTPVTVPSDEQEQDEEEAKSFKTRSTHDDKPAAEPRRVTFRDDVDTNSESDGRPVDRRAAFARGPSKRLMTFRQLLFTKQNKKRHRTIKTIDRRFFYVLFISYVLFVILMFATTSVWDDSKYLTQ